MEWFITLAVAVAGVAVAGAVVLLYLAFVRPPRNRPKDFLKAGRAATTKTVMACLGDSNTHASLASSYVTMLRDRLAGQGYQFINAGRNGAPSAGLLKRLDEIIACQPDAVAILIGSNDARTTKDRGLDAYRDNLNRILQRLRAGTAAQLALLSLPPLGEDLASQINQSVGRYNELVADAAAAHGASYLPLHEALVALISKHLSGRPRPYRLRFTLMFANAFRRYVRRRSWDEIATRNGLIVSIDQAHLNDRGAATAADLIADWLVQPSSATGGASWRVDGTAAASKEQ
jgi:acyl-CoA thioesterase I